ncbi:MAG: type II toxin-antitoxin system VapB family antitoxin [Verrucomicrobia bacterium]|nr:type II toxin-antitoxin system VapB family antitoxin [Verrucomicrobiota bacterium]
MKTTLDIPEKELQDVISFTQARTKREAIVTAVADFNRRRRMAALVKHLGTCKNMMTEEELRRMREEK